MRSFSNRFIRRIVFSVFLRIERQIMHFMRIVMQIEELHVVVLEDFLKRDWSVKGGRCVVATEFVPAVECERNEPAFRQCRLCYGGLRRGV